MEMANYPQEEIFLGRLDEQERFRETLRSAIKNKDNKSLPYVFLLYGEGGMGKSRLAQRIHDIAKSEEEFKNHFLNLWLDWERRKELDYRLAARDAVSPELVFEHIYAIFRDRGFGRQFDSYEKAVKERGTYESKVAQALENTRENHDERYAPLREGGAKMLAWLVRTGIPGGAAIPEEPTAKAFEALVEGGAEGLARAREAATNLVRATLIDPDAFDLFTLPNETLARRLAEGIRASAARKPILLFLDTYEIADHADTWFREVVKRAGSKIIWVIAGRDNLADTRKYGQTNVTGYRADFSSDRLRVFQLGEFSVEDIKDYFVYRAPQRPLDDKNAEAIHRVTLGIPLAVREAAAIWSKPITTIEDITGNEPPSRNRDKIVQTMTERFLLHCFNDPNHSQDRMRLYALALCRRPYAELLTAICQCEDLEQELSDLERRHSFVFVDEMKLHDKVTTFLREYLMQEIRRKSKEVQGIHERAVTHIETEKKAREDGLLTLEARVADERWTAALLNLTHHRFWLDEESGWQTLLPAFIGGLIYGRGFARALVEIAENFSPVLLQSGKKRLKILQDGLFWFPSPDEEAALIAELKASSRLWTEDGCVMERQAILEYLVGELNYHRKQYSAALEVYENAVEKLADENKVLPIKISDALYDVSSRFIWPDEASLSVQTTQSLRACELALTLNPTNGNALYNYACTLSNWGKPEEALDIISKAISIEERSTRYNLLGIIYRSLNRINDAIEAYQKAIELDPKYANAWHSLGNIYRSLDHTSEAICAYRKAIELDPKFSYPWDGLGSTYRDLDLTDDAIAAYQKAIDLNPKFATPWNMMGNLYIKNSQLDKALKALNKAIEIDPEDGMLNSSLAGILRRLNMNEQYTIQVERTRPLIMKENEYNRACFESICGNTKEALKFLKTALEKKQTSFAWARRDPDFDFIRDDLHFKELVGEE